MVNRELYEQTPLVIRGPALLRDAFRAMLSGSTRAIRAGDPFSVTLLVGDNCGGWAPPEGLHDVESCILVTRGDHAELLTGSRLGIQIYVGIEDEPDELRQAVQAAAKGEAYCSRSLLPRLLRALREGPRPAVKEAPAHHADSECLSDREREVALLAASGRSNEQVAARLFISVATVKFHLGNVYRKLSISRRGQLVAALPTLQSNGMTHSAPFYEAGRHQPSGYPMNGKGHPIGDFNAL